MAAAGRSDQVEVRWLSNVAGILSPDGGLRTVVAALPSMDLHLAKGERLFVVPGLLVEEPVPFNSALMAYCIRMAHRTVVRALAPENPCGDCRMCCKTPYIKTEFLGHPFEKASHSVCSHCDSEVGCSVNYAKPTACRSFRCLWLQSRDKNWIMPDELRPDRCGVIFTGPEDGDPENLIYLHPNAHDREAHNRKAVVRWIEQVQAEGQSVRFVTHYYGEDAAPAEVAPV